MHARRHSMSDPDSGREQEAEIFTLGQWSEWSKRTIYPAHG